MTKLFKKIKRVDKAIKEKIAELTSTKDPLNGYFLKIGTEEERRENIEEINMELRMLYSEKYSAIETLERDLHIEKMNVSNLERDLSLSVNQ